jgi:TonB family protein
MNTRHLLLAVVSLALSAPALSCEPHAIKSSAAFPMRSQLRGQEGIVYLNLKIDENGRVASTQIEQSSGYRLLDHAAQDSAVKEWVFDVSGCERKDLPANRVIAIEYRNDEYR